MASSPKTAKLKRSELLDRYVALSAIGTVADALRHHADGDGLIDDELWDDLTEQLDRLSTPALAELWPADSAYEETSEYALANALHGVLASRLFARLAESSERLRELSDRYAANAQRDVVRLLTIDPEGEPLT